MTCPYANNNTSSPECLVYHYNESTCKVLFASDMFVTDEVCTTNNNIGAHCTIVAKRSGVQAVFDVDPNHTVDNGRRQPWAREGACPPLENKNVTLLGIYIENVYDFHRKKWSAHPWKYGLPIRFSSEKVVCPPLEIWFAHP